MKLSQLLTKTDWSFLTEKLDAANDPQIDLCTADSRKVRPNTLFVALKGARADGASHIPSALEKGAAAIVRKGATAISRENNAFYIALPDPAAFLAAAAYLLSGSPAPHLVAITGTNGKTSTADFLRQIWEMRGIKSASIGTLGVRGADLHPGSTLTTPSAEDLPTLLKKCQAKGITHIALEASSHGLEQGRLAALPLKAGAFLNLTRDHLDYHGDLENYFHAKSRLADLLPNGAPFVLTPDITPEYLGRLRKKSADRLKIREIGSRPGTLRLVKRTARPDGQDLTLILPDGKSQTLNLPLIGDFQAHNVLTAALLAAESEQDLPDVLALLEKLAPVPGRLEKIGVTKKGGAVFVDYAHTPDALQKALTALRSHLPPKAKLWVLFGAGGDRDRGKRPLMGREAAKLADHIIITDDNPRFEAPANIRREVLAGCPQAEEIPDRKQAILAALKRLQKGDILLVAGKGHETGQSVKGVIHPFDDRALTRVMLSENRSLQSG